MMSYDNSIKNQQYKKRELDNETKEPQYVWKSSHIIEQHATKVYTSKLFFEVQKEIYNRGGGGHGKDLGK